MIAGNLIGFLMFIVVAFIIAIAHFFLRLSDSLTMTLAGLTLFIIDLFFRLWHKQDDRWFYGNNQGGNLFFLPAWFFGLIIFFVNLIRFIFWK